MMMILMIGTNNELRCSFSSRETSFRGLSEFPVKRIADRARKGAHSATVHSCRLQLQDDHRVWIRVDAWA